MTFFIFRLLAFVDGAWFYLRNLRAGSFHPVTAGAGVQSGHSVAVDELEGVSWPEFPTLAHSFWRAQELTLFRRHQSFFSAPALDLGCGDGIFAGLAGFPEDGLGTDLDFLSLAAAVRRRKGLPPVVADVGHLPVGDRVIATCLSNSVLEHLSDLDRCLSEVARVLRPGGYFIFSMTLGMFTLQLRHLAGKRDARRWIRMYGHHQEPGEIELVYKLQEKGFSVEACINYQPLQATAVYRFLISPAFQFVERRMSSRLVSSLRRRLIPSVARSLAETPAGKGACCFIIARRKLC